jgi:transposase
MLNAKVDAQAQGELQKAMKTTANPKQYRRLKAVDLSGQGVAVPDVARLLDFSEATVRTLIHSYNEAGLAGLALGYGAGRPMALEWSIAEWQDLLAQAPASFDQLHTGAQNWTQNLLRDYLAAYHGLKVSQMTISNALKRVGLNWKRAKLRTHSPDPLYVVKRERLEQLKRLALAGELTSAASSHPRSDEPPKPANLVFLDSTDLHWCPDIGYCYGPIAHQQKVDSPGLLNPWYALFGSLVFPTGAGLYTLHHRKRALELREHLQLLIDSDPDAFWFVVLDNAGAHTTRLIHQFAQEHLDRLELVFLPTYSPHLNFIERLWRLLRLQVTRNQFYASLTDLAEAAVRWLERLAFAQFCALMGIDESELGFL